MPEGQNPIPGWYNDPFDTSQIRWWDGAAWTEHAKPFPNPAAPEIPPAAAPPSQFPSAPGSAFPMTPIVEPGIAAGLVDPSAAAASVLPGVDQSPAPASAPPAAGSYGTPAQQFDSPFAGGQYPPATAQAQPEPQVAGPAATGYPFGSFPGDPTTQASPDLPYGIAQSPTPGVETGQPFGAVGGAPAQFGASDYQPNYGGAAAGAETVGQGGGPGYGAYAGYSGQPGVADAGIQQQPYNEPAVAQPTSPPAKSSKMMLILLIVLGVVVVAAAAVWFFMLRSSDTPAPKVTLPAPASTPASPGAATTPAAPAVGAIAPATCSSAITALTADGSASTVVARLEAAATNQGLAEAAGFFTDVTQQTASVLTSSGSPCVDAAKAGQAPTSYATFIEQFSKATHDGAAIAALGAAANGILTPEQANALRADAAALASAQSAVAPGAVPAAPAPAS